MSLFKKCLFRKLGVFIEKKFSEERKPCNCKKLVFNNVTCCSVITGWERTVHVSRCPALYSGRIFVPLCRELIIFVF